MSVSPLSGLSSSPASGWVPLRILDVNNLDWGEPRFGAKTKWLFEGEKGSHLLFCQFAPQGVPTPRPGYIGPHYHLFHEWAYITDGDFITYEFVHARQRRGELLHYRTGTWLDRPAYSIHDGEGGAGGAHQQGSCTMLIMEEGSSSATADPMGGLITLDPQSRFYKPESREVKQFTTAHFVHSAESVDWESDPELPGASIKWLSDDQTRGFRGRLHFVPAGWTFARAPEKSHHKQAHRFIYVLFGDLTVWTYDNPNSSGVRVEAKKDFFIDQPPMSIWGWGTGPVSKSGCMWLEVTYAAGTIIGGGSIEEPTVLAR